MVAYNINNIEGKIQNLWTTNTLFDKKHDEQRSLCAPGIANCLYPLRTTSLSYVDRISSTVDVVAKVSYTIWMLILSHAQQLFT